MEPVHLNNLNKEELKNFFNSFDAVFSDCDGVIWFLDSFLEGAAKTIEKLRSIGKRVSFVTNNCLHPFEALHDKLERNKFEVEKDGLINPMVVLADYLKKINFDKEIFTLSGDAVKFELEKRGYKIIPNGPDRLVDGIPSLKTHLQDNLNVGAVVIDIDLNINYINLMMAITYLKRKDVKLFCLASDAIIPITKDFRVLGPHYFLEIMSEVSSQKPIHCGKPHKLLADYIKNKIQIVDPKRILFIGDNLLQDISFANINGFQSLLVLSGTTSKEDLENWNRPDEQKPKYYIESLPSLLKLMEKL